MFLLHDKTSRRTSLRTSAFLIIVIKVLCCQTLTCRPEEYQIGNKCCPLCQPGNRVETDCTESSDTSCLPCTSGTYMDEFTKRTLCFPCTNCDAGSGLKVKRSCTTTSDTVCEPLEGFFCTGLTKDQCKAAQKHKDCDPGQYIKEKGTSSSDTVCSDCSDGTFSDGTLTSCHQHTQCESMNLQLITAGTKSADAVCGGKTSNVGVNVGIKTSNVGVNVGKQPSNVVVMEGEQTSNVVVMEGKQTPNVVVMEGKQSSNVVVMEDEQTSNVGVLVGKQISKNVKMEGIKISNVKVNVGKQPSNVGVIAGKQISNDVVMKDIEISDVGVTVDEQTSNDEVTVDEQTSNDGVTVDKQTSNDGVTVDTITPVVVSVVLVVGTVLYYIKRQNKCPAVTDKNNHADNSIETLLRTQQSVEESMSLSEQEEVKPV